MRSWIFLCFLRGSHGKPCVTYFERRESPVLRLNCQQAGGRVDSGYKGYADRLSLERKFFLGPPWIKSTYFTLEEHQNFLYFGETRLTDGSLAITELETEQDSAGTFLLRLLQNQPSIRSPG
ncbi:MAG: hypothetical protein JW748_02245 [Anaerolineales bacterium]|nr:hypothetical protein [Anaerolineales bacterium]